MNQDSSATKLPYTPGERVIVEAEYVKACDYANDDGPGYVEGAILTVAGKSVCVRADALRSVPSDCYIRLTEDEGKKILWNALGAADYSDDVYRDVCRTVEHIVNQKRGTTVQSFDEQDVSKRLRAATGGGMDHGTHHELLTPGCEHCQLLIEAAKTVDTLAGFAAKTNDEKNLLLREASQQAYRAPKPEATNDVVFRMVDMATALNYGKGIPAGDYFKALALAAFDRADEVTING